MLSRIRQIAVAVADLDRSRSFYRDILGVKHLFDAPHLAFFDLDGIWLMLSDNPDETPRPGSTLYFEVPDIRQAHAQLKARGVDFIDEPHLIADMGSYELWMNFFKDPDGTVLAIRSEVKK